MEVQCCVCHKVRKGETWGSGDHYDIPHQDVSHGYCPKCEAKAKAELQAFHRWNGLVKASIRYLTQLL